MRYKRNILFMLLQLFAHKFVVGRQLLFGGLWWALAWASLLGADEWSATLSEANTQYVQKRYREALDGYKQLEGKGLESVAMYGCMGNAYLSIDSTAGAILYYERALLLAPQNADLRHNLAVANGRVTDPIEAVPVFFGTRLWRNTTSLLVADTWGIVSLGVMWLASVCTLFFMYRSKDRHRKWYFWAAAFLLTMDLLMTFLGGNRLAVERDHSRGVLMPRQVSVKGEAQATSSEIGQAPGGTVVRILENNNGWVKIQLPDGNEGWVAALSVAVI